MLINVSLIRRRLALWWEETGQYQWENARPSAGCWQIFPLKGRQEASVSWAWAHIDRLSHEGTCYIWNGHIWQQLENILPCNVCIGCLWHVLTIIKSLSVLSYHDYLFFFFCTTRSQMCFITASWYKCFWGVIYHSQFVQIVLSRDLSQSVCTMVFGFDVSQSVCTNGLWVWCITVSLYK